MRRPAPSHAPPPDDPGWFPVKITGAVAGTTPAGYAAAEQWVDGAGVRGDKAGGRVLGAANYGVPLDPAWAFAAGDLALARPAPGAGGLLFELQVIPAAGAASSCCPSPPAPATVPLGCVIGGGGMSGGSGGAGQCRVYIWSFCGTYSELFIPCDLVPAIGRSQSEYYRATFDTDHVTTIRLMCSGMRGCRELMATLPSCPGVDSTGFPVDDCLTAYLQSHPEILQQCPPVAVSRRLCGTLSGGTGSFGGLGTVPVGADFNFARSSNSGWAVSYTSPDGSVSVGGVVRACPDRTPGGLYFVGTVSGAGAATGFPCGCRTTFSGCEVGTAALPSQTITAGPTYDSGGALTSQTLRIETACGGLTLTLAPCDPPSSPPPPPPPPGTTYNCSSGNCVPADGGAYPTLADCQAACACTAQCPDLGPTLVVHLTGGTTVTVTGGGGQWNGAGGGVTVNLFFATFQGAPSRWVLSITGRANESPTACGCAPFFLTFGGSGTTVTLP